MEVAPSVGNSSVVVVSVFIKFKVDMFCNMSAVVEDIEGMPHITRRE